MADPVSHDPQSLFSGLDGPAGGGLTLLYTSPSGAGMRGTRMIGIHVCNHTNAAVMYRLTHTESGGTAAADKSFVWDWTVPPDGVTYMLAEGIQLNPGDMLHHEAGVAASIAVHGYGWEMTD